MVSAPRCPDLIPRKLSVFSSLGVVMLDTSCGSSWQDQRLKRTEQPGGGCMCGGTLCTLLTEPDTVFKLHTMTFYTIACFKLEFPVPTQKRLRVRFPSLVDTR